MSIAVGQFVVPSMGLGNLLGLAEKSWQLAAVNGFTSSLIVNSIDGIVSGDFDLGEILGNATFAGMTAGITSAVNLDDFGITQKTHPELFEGLLSFGANHLSIANILDGAIDGIISSGLSSAVYKTDFMEGFSASLVSTVVNLTLADVQFEIGELFTDADGQPINGGEGSFGHALLHGLAGCAAGAALNGSGGCAPGAAGAIAQSLFAGSLEGVTPEERQERLAQAEFIGALAGFLFSQGEGENVDLAATIARSAFENNYLTHDQLKAFLEELEACRENYNDCDFGDLLKRYQEASQKNSDALRDCGLDSACVAKHLDEIKKAYALAEAHFFADDLDLSIAPLAVLQARDMQLAVHQMVRIKYLEGVCPDLGGSCVERVEAEALNDFLTDFMPIIGDGKAFYEAYQSGEVVDWGLAIAALVPMLGDAIKSGVKASKLSKLMDDMPDDWTIDQDTGKVFDNEGFEVTIKVDDTGNPSWDRVNDNSGGDIKPDTPDVPDTPDTTKPVDGVDDTNLVDGGAVDGNKGRIDIETGARPDANELRAGEGLANQGYNIRHRQPVSDQGVQNQRTSDLYVDGVGDVDVYTPQNSRPTSIARGIESKNDQAPGVLVQSDLTNTQMTEVANRVWGKPTAQNINTIFFQNSAGDIITFTRPQ